VEADRRRSLTGRHGRDPAGAGLYGVEAKARLLPHPARRRQQADPEVEVLADAQPALAKGLHATPDVVGDPLPGLRIGAEHGVGLALPGRSELDRFPVDAGVPGAGAAYGEANPRPAGGHVDHLRVEALDQRL
jgi:hypothetical protein